MGDYNFPAWLNQGYLIEHRNWRKTLQTVFALCNFARPGEVIQLVGPTRVGKSKLTNMLLNRLNVAAIESDNNFVCAVKVIAANEGGNNYFSMKAFMQRIVNAIEHPILGSDKPDGMDNFKAEYSRRLTEANLREAGVRGITFRKILFLIVDEAQHLGYVQGGLEGQKRVLDSLKAFAEDAGVVLILSGTYELQRVIEHSTHLTARTSHVHFQRYQETEEDLNEFARILSSYDQLLSLPKGFSLTKHIKPIYKETFGCIGMLDKWVRQTSAICLFENEDLSFKKLMEAKLPCSEREKIITDINKGEESLSASSQPKKQKDTLEKKQKTKTKPFQKKPKRYQAGNRTGGKND